MSVYTTAESREVRTIGPCECGDRSALPAECGQPQTWECDVWGGCHRTWEETKKHHVMRFHVHAVECDTKRMPVGWCGCEAIRTAGCIDCEKEFPHDVQPGPEVEIYE